MKNLLTISLLISFFNCSSQTVVPLNARSTDIPTSNYYRKDLDNVLNKFEGTWKYQNGNTSFTVKFVKKQKVKVTDYYTDELCGWYQYIEDGVEIVNTIPFTDNFSFITNGSSVSADGTKIYRMFFKDPERPKASYFLTIKYNNNGMGNPPTIEWDVKLVGVSYKMEGEPNHLTSLRVPAIITLTQQ